MKYKCPNCGGFDGKHSGMDQCPSDPPWSRKALRDQMETARIETKKQPDDDGCTCIQDESRGWIYCPEHGEKVRQERAHNKKIGDQIAKLAREREQWASDHNWPLVGGRITTFITMWQCPICYAPVLLPEQHNEWHERQQQELSDLYYEMRNGHAC